MSRQFFSVLGDQLISIRNSPFFKLGQKQTINDPTLLRSQLSYDPDRLFNQQKFQQKNEGIEDKDFLEVLQEERQASDRLEFDLLREATREDFQRKVKELSLRKDGVNAPKQYSIFRTARGACLSCKKCASYRGNFGRHDVRWTADPSKTVNFLGCLHCRCPMNSHQLIRPLSQNRQTIWNYLKSKRMGEEYLNVSYFVSAFAVERGSGEEQLMEVAQLLEKVGFKIKDCKMMEKWGFQMGLLRAGLLTHGEDPSVQEAAMRLAQCVAEAGRWTEAGEEFQQYLHILRKVALESRGKMLKELTQDDNVLLFLVQTENFNSSQHRKFLQALQEYTKPAELLYLSGDKRQSILLAQQFFPLEFTLSSRLFLLPQGAEQNLLRFRDVVDYNGYSVLFENVTNIKRIAAENMLSFLSYHEQVYLMGKDMASDVLPKMPLIFAAKAGPHHLNHYGHLPPFIEVPPVQQQQLIRQLFPDYGVGQRCVVVLRPMLAGSGFEEIVANLLRINNFTIIQRIRGALSLESAQYLAALEHITTEDSPAYLSLMTTGICQILLVSRKSALYAAHVLLNHSDRSLADINPRTIRARPSIQIRRGKEIFKEDFNLPEIRNSMDVFTGAGNLLNLSNCLFGPSCEGRVRVLENCRTGELIKVAQQGESNGNLKATLRQRQQMLGQLKKDNFNYLLFNSKSDKSTEELVSLFFPQCTLFQSAVVLLKPSYLHLLGEIKQVLTTLRYHIIFSKTVQLSKQFSEELITDLQKLKMDHELLREAVELYSGQRVTFLCVSKLSARKEILFLLSNFSFLPTRTILQTDQSQQVLKEVLVPVWTNEQRYLKVFNRHLSNLEEAALLLTDESQGRLTPEDRQDLNQYFIGSIFANRPDASNNTTIGKLSLYCTSSQMAKFQSWYFSTLSNFYPNSVPLLFQYRNFGKTTLVIQSHSGQPFVNCFMNQYLQEMKQQEKGRGISDSGEAVKKRNSIVLLLWAKKIFKFVEELSLLATDAVTIPIEVQGWGQILHHNNQYRAELTETQCIQRDRKFLENVIVKYAGNRYILTNCKKMLESRILPERYKVENRRLLPSFEEGGVEDGLRVVERGQISRLYLKGQFQMIDPDNQKNTDSRNLLALNLYRVCPYVDTRYSLLAQILLFFDRLQEQAHQHRQAFGDILEHLQGFLVKYDDLEFLQFQIYMLQLKQLARGEVTEDRLRAYPSLRKGRNRGGEQVVGKNRKFLDQKQYFKPSQQQSSQALEEIRLKYTNFNLKTLDQPLQNHVLNNKEDFLHKQWTNQGNVVNLLRQEARKAPAQNQQRGVYVQYEKVLNQNEERIKSQLQGQVQKLGNQQEETVLRDRGIDDEIWYKRIRSGIGKSGKVDEAISKQLEKLSKFKSSNSSNTA